MTASNRSSPVKGPALAFILDGGDGDSSGVNAWTAGDFDERGRGAGVFGVVGDSGRFLEPELDARGPEADRGAGDEGGVSGVGGRSARGASGRFLGLGEGEGTPAVVVVSRLGGVVVGRLGTGPVVERGRADRVSAAGDRLSLLI